MTDLLERPALRTLVPLLGLALVAACGGSPDTPPSIPAPAAPDFRDLEAPTASSDLVVATNHQQQGDGWALFAGSCGECHSLQPPTKKAPPMLAVLQRYAMMYPGEGEAREAMIFWVANADEDWSVMPARTIRHYGVMPRMDLPPEQVGEIVDYLMSLRTDGPATPRTSGG